MATLRDVAKLAGVSHTTVSMVVNRDPRISPATRERVQAAVQQLGFVPDATARKLARGRTGVLAVVIPELGSAFAQQVLVGVETALRGTELDLQIHSGRDVHPVGTDTPYRTAVVERLLAGRRADAIIQVTAHGDHKVRRPDGGPFLPLVAVEHAGTYDRAVFFDNVAAGRLGYGHLLERGRRRIAVVNGDVPRMRTPQDRDAGARQAAAAAGHALRDEDCFTVYLHHFEEGVALWPRLKAGGFDAVFCPAGDMVALGILAAAGRDGVRVPEDLALLGTDGLAVAEAVGLSTVVQPMQAMGAEAVRLALQALAEGPAEPSAQVMAPTLSQGRST